MAKVRYPIQPITVLSSVEVEVNLEESGEIGARTWGLVV
jgi:hypothetical protein